MSGTVGVAGAGADLLQFWLLRMARRQHHSEQDTIRKKMIKPPKDATYQTTDHESRGVESLLAETLSNQYGEVEGASYGYTRVFTSSVGVGVGEWQKHSTGRTWRTKSY